MAPKKISKLRRTVAGSVSRAALGKGRAFWDSMPWTAVDVPSLELGEAADTIFMGLEELDGNAFLASKTVAEVGNQAAVVEPQEQAELRSISSEAKLKSHKSRSQAPKANAFEAVDEVGGEEELPTDKPNETSKKRKLEKVVVTVVPENSDKKKRKKKEKQLKKEKTVSAAAESVQSIEFDQEKALAEAKASALWGTSEHQLLLSQPLAEALKRLAFAQPTPIQREAVPPVICSACDLVGVAETGSGKTLAFVLPVVHAMLTSWSYQSSNQMPRSEAGDTCTADSQHPFALVVAPTRELALQISRVFTDICNQFKDRYRIGVVAVVGGLSEQKQRRLLSGGMQNPVHVVIGTPGRLSEMMSDEELVAFQDMSRLRFLIVDEADRMIEDGHFADLHRIFSRVKDHEALVQQGTEPIVAYRKKLSGNSFDEDKDEMDTYMTQNEPEVASIIEKEDDSDSDGDGDVLVGFGEQQDSNVVDLEHLDTEVQQMEQYMNKDSVTSDYEWAMEQLRQGGNPESSIEPAFPTKVAVRKVPEFHLKRQTLLFSATVTSVDNYAKQKKEQKWKLAGNVEIIETNNGGNRGKKTVKAVDALPTHVRHLLSVVAVQKTIKVIDVNKTAPVETKDVKVGTNSTVKTTNDSNPGNSASMGVTLPTGLKQLEMFVTTEDKDIYAYEYFSRNPGRSLLFVNSIKTARRVDGLLRALGINSRTIHAQMQQRQRLKAMDGFVSTPIGVLVATDVAARGLDIPKVQTVIHYDIARSPQVYVHRSGRTARAGEVGTTVSLVSPEDNEFHSRIIAHLRGSSTAHPLTSYTKQINLAAVPMLRARVQLAKKIFTMSFVEQQQSKEMHWLETSAHEADLQLDDELQAELGGSEEKDDSIRSSVGGRRPSKQQKKELGRMRGQLQRLLDLPLEASPAVVTGNGVQDTDKRKFRRKDSKKKSAPGMRVSSKQIGKSFFVYAK